MLKTSKPLVILAIIGFIALPSGKALKCYQCTPTDKDDCELLKDDMSKECSAPIKPTELPTTTDKPPSIETKPTPATDKPTTIQTKPTPATDKPTTIQTKPTPATDKPTTIQTKPTPATDKPTTIQTKPTPATDKPPTIQTKPTPATDKPPIIETKPTPATDKPPIIETKPTPATDKPPSIEIEPSPEGDKGKLRKRRSLINRFSRVQPFDEAEKPFCYTMAITVNNQTKTERGCGVGKQADYCKDKKDCKVCDSDNCNSATSNIVYTSMIMSLVIVVLFTK